jgi:hypothetical protein
VQNGLYVLYKWQAFEHSNKPALHYNRVKIRVLPITWQPTVVRSMNIRDTVTSLTHAIYVSEGGSVIGIRDFDFMLISPRFISWSQKARFGVTDAEKQNG